MKIFLSFLQGEAGYPIPAYNFWQYYIKNGIEEAGHEWRECPDVDWAFGLVPKTKVEHSSWKSNSWERTVKSLKISPTDIFLSYLYPEQIDTAAIKEIQKMGIPCINFFCDNVRDFKKIPIEFAAFDMNWVPEYKAISFYKKAGYSYINLPMPVWIEPRFRTYQPEKNRQISFIGSRDLQRQLFFECLVQCQPEMLLSIYGRGWDEEKEFQSVVDPGYSFNRKLFFQYDFIKQLGLPAYIRKLQQRNKNRALSKVLRSKIHPSPNFELYNELTSTSMITLGINRYPSYQFPISAPNTYSRLRDLEAPMLGACYLTEMTSGLNELYDIGLEIETYCDTEDFIYKVNELTADVKKRKTLKINGQKRALQDHGIPQSLDKLFKKLSIN